MKNINQVLKENNHDIKIVCEFVKRWNKSDKEFDVANSAERLLKSNQNLISAFKEMVEEIKTELENGLGTNKQLDDAFPVVKKVLANLLSSLTEEKI